MSRTRFHFSSDQSLPHLSINWPSCWYHIYVPICHLSCVLLQTKCFRFGKRLAFACLVFYVLSNRNTSPVFCTVFVVFFECLHMAPVSNVLQEVLMTNSCSTCMRTLPTWDQQPLDLCQDDPLVVLALQRVNRNLADSSITFICHICESVCTFYQVTPVGRQHPRVVISAQAQRFPLPLPPARRGPASSGGSWTA